MNYQNLVFSKNASYFNVSHRINIRTKQLQVCIKTYADK